MAAHSALLSLAQGVDDLTETSKCLRGAVAVVRSDLMLGMREGGAGVNASDSICGAEFMLVVAGMFTAGGAAVGVLSSLVDETALGTVGTVDGLTVEEFVGVND